MLKKPIVWLGLWVVAIACFYVATQIVHRPGDEAPSRPMAMRPGPAANAGAAPAAAGGASISGTIELAPALAKNWAATDVLFVIARRSGVGGPPVAAKKLQADKFPFAFSLSSADVMLQGVVFEGDLDVIVRIDKDGDAASKTPGDMMGKTSAPVAVGSKDVKVVIDQTL